MATVKGGRRLSLAIRNTIIKYHLSGISTVKIREILQNNHGFKTTRQSVRRFLIRYGLTGSVLDNRFVFCISILVF